MRESFIFLPLAYIFTYIYVYIICLLLLFLSSMLAYRKFSLISFFLLLFFSLRSCQLENILHSGPKSQEAKIVKNTYAIFNATKINISIYVYIHIIIFLCGEYHVTQTHIHIQRICGSSKYQDNPLWSGTTTGNRTASHDILQQ